MYVYVSVFHVCIILPRSGSEEDYTTLHQLLEDISCYLSDFTAANDAKKEAARKKEKEDKRKGEDMRKAAMDGMASMSVNVVQKIITAYSMAPSGRFDVTRTIFKLMHC